MLMRILKILASRAISRSASARSCKVGDLLQTADRISPDPNLHDKRKVVGPATRKSPHHPIERSFAAPVIVIFASGAVEAESYVRNCVPIPNDLWPNAIEMPSVGYKAAFQILGSHCFDDAGEVRMKRWLSAGEHHLLDSHGFPGPGDHAAEKID